MQKPQFVENEIYHIYNRGVEKRKIFTEDADYFRFIHDLFEFNNESPVLNTGRHFIMNGVEPHSLKRKRESRKLLVEILAFVLMPNHFHLLLKQKKERGIVRFMQKLGTGYTLYFNEKNKRVGSLFQGRFKAVLVKTDAHILHLPFYIHANPLSLIDRSTDRSSTSFNSSLNFLEHYRWSSYMDYIEIKNFPSVTSREFLLEFLGGELSHKTMMKDWIKNKEERIEDIKNIVFEE
ncbi:MAG: transposase [Parcubacteria group bacterium]|nr:transposase [Parcubacteria group bacterium]